MSVISGILGAKAQKDSASTAANAQTQAAQIATDAQLKMWEKAQADWGPYLNAGYQGITSLQTQMPKYLQETVMPAYNNYMTGLGTAQYNPNAFTINPVTGQVGSGATSGNQLYNVNQGTSQVPSAVYTAQGNTVAGNAVNAAAQVPSNTLGTPLQKDPTHTSDGGYGGITTTINGVVQPGNESADQKAKAAEIAATNKLNNMQMQNVISSSASPNALNQNAISGANYTPTPTPTGGYGSGELLPELPTLQQDMDFSWNADDPVYQYKMQQAQEAANRSLAKQGLMGSRAGVNTLSDVAMNVAAEDIDKQYNRNLAERDYRTQTAMDQYNLASTRGNTLYDRLLNQQNTLYGRLTGQQETALGRLGQAYSLGNNMYGTVNEQNLNLAKIGTGAAGSAGANSMQAGQQIGNNAMAAGQANAQAALASGQAQAGMYNNIGNSLMQAGATYANYQNSQPSYYSGGNNYYAGGYGNSPNSYVDTSIYQP